MTTKRLFFALWPDEATAVALGEWACQVHALCGGRIMPRENLHLTLMFLGQVPHQHLPELHALLAERWQGGTLLLDIYGRFRGPRIVWAGTSQPAAWLYTMQKNLQAHLTRMGLPPPDENFHPHISLLRDAGPQDLSALPPPEAIDWRSARMVLAESRPRPGGSHYVELASRALDV